MITYKNYEPFIMSKTIKYQYVLFFIFLFALALLRLPSFSLFIFPNKLSTSHTLSKIVFFLTFIYFVFNKGFANIFLKKSGVFLFIAIFFASQSISILTTADILYFWKTYHNIVLSIMIFYIAFLISNKNDEKIYVIYFIVLSLILTIIAFVYFFFPNSILNSFQNFIDKDYLSAFQLDLDRSRNTLSLGQEILLPFILFRIKNLDKHSIVFLIFTLIIIFLSIVSNYRTFMLITFTILSVFFLKKNVFSQRIRRVLFLCSILFVVVSVYISSNALSISIIDRLSFLDEFNSTGSITYRISSLQKSLDLFLYSPISGIGLGNYGLFQKKTFNSMNTNAIDYSNLVLDSPHNIISQIISETGSIGLFSFVILIIYFIKLDYSFVAVSKNKYIFPYIVSSWSIFIFLLFNPSNSLPFLSWFWFIRGIISGIET